MDNTRESNRLLKKHYAAAASDCRNTLCENCDFVKEDGSCCLHNPYWLYSNVDCESSKFSSYETDRFVDELYMMPHKELVVLCRDLMLECDDLRGAYDENITEIAEEIEERLKKDE